MLTYVYDPTADAHCGHPTCGYRLGTRQALCGHRVIDSIIEGRGVLVNPGDLPDNDTADAVRAALLELGVEAFQELNFALGQAGLGGQDVERNPGPAKPAHRPRGHWECEVPEGV